MRPQDRGIKNSRHPDEIFLLLLCMFAGAGLVFGDAPAPDSVEASLPPWAVVGWGIGLLVGPLVTLLGILWQRDRHDGILIEQVGQVITGGSALVYAAILLVALWPAGFVAGCIILAFGGARFWRWWQLQKVIDDAVRQVTAHEEGERHGE